MPNADVEIMDVNKGTTESTKTDRDGVYRFFFLSPSQYSLTVEHDGFRKESRNVTVLLGTPVTVNITLEIAKANMQLFVTAEAPLVQADNGDVSITMSQRQISELPNPGNDLTYIAQTAPGAIMNTDNALTGGGGGNVSILGMPGTSNLFTLNGMNDNSGHLNFTGASGMLLGQNQIQEATVVSDGYSGHFGDAAGSYVNYVTKSGGNEFPRKRQVLLEWQRVERYRLDHESIWQSSARSISPISGRVRWEGPSRRIGCFSFLIPKACESCCPLLFR